MAKAKAAERARRRIVRRALRIIHDCEQAIIDAEHWNGLNLGETPLDVEDFRVMRLGALRVYRAHTKTGENHGS